MRWMIALCLLSLGWQAGLSAHDHEGPGTLLGELASAPGRAEWAPLSVLGGRADLLPWARQALHQPSATDRGRGALLLGMLELPAGQAAAHWALRDPAREVRLRAAVALCLLQDDTGIAGARVALTEGPPWLRVYAVLGLWRLGDDRARAALQAALPRQSEFLQDLMQAALKTPPPPRLNPCAQPAPDQPVTDLTDAWERVADAWVLESDHWWHKGNYDQCIRAQEAALEFDPQHVELYSNIAWLQWSMGRHGEAIRSYRRGLQANPDRWEAAHQLGLYYRGHGHLLLAEQYFRRAAELGSPPVERRQWGHTLEKLGRPDEALVAWQQVLKLDPTDPIARRQVERLSAPAQR
jgi:hypothetical protein